MRTHILARKTHKWIGLLVGLQFVFWTLTGLYMTVVHIDIIHGDHLVRSQPKRSVSPSGLRDPAALAAAAGADEARLVWLRGRPAYALGTAALVDARSGAAIAPPNEAEIRALARASYRGTEPIASARLITEIPGEIRGRKPPLWRVEFDHWNKPTFYLSPVTGEMLTRRHELWRAFDLLWMLHIMDYDERENVNNTLLRVFTWAAVLMALSGAWMLLYAFPKKKKKKAVRA